MSRSMRSMRGGANATNLSLNLRNRVHGSFTRSQTSKKNTLGDVTLPTNLLQGMQDAKGSQRRPNLLKSIVAYTVFWSTFIPQCAKLLLSVDNRIKDFFDLSTFGVPESVKRTIDEFKERHSLNSSYTELITCDRELMTKFCQDTSDWTNRIKSIEETFPASADNLINLDDLLELLYIRFQYTLSEPPTHSNASVTIEQKVLMTELITRVQKTLLKFCPDKNAQNWSWLSFGSSKKLFFKKLLEKSGISPDKMEQIIPQFIDMLQSDVFSENFKECHAIRKFKTLFQISPKEAGGSLMSTKKRGGEGVGVFIILACFACCGYFNHKRNQLTRDSDSA